MNSPTFSVKFAGGTLIPNLRANKSGITSEKSRPKNESGANTLLHTEGEPPFFFIVAFITTSIF
jgi:hypothetical protein